MREPTTHRVRRGKLVMIPEQWRGQVPSNQTMLQRKTGRIEVRAGRKKRLRDAAKEHWDNQLGDE